MQGDEKVRFCGKCEKHVHNLTAMTEAEAAAVVGTGQACIRFQSRADGTVLTRPCAADALAAMKRAQAESHAPLAWLGAGLGVLAGGAAWLATQVQQDVCGVIHASMSLPLVGNWLSAKLPDHLPTTLQDRCFPRMPMGVMAPPPPPSAGP